MVDAPSGRPEAAGVGSLEETVALLEQEVVVDELLLGLFAHAGQRVEGALKLALETAEGRWNFFFHLLVLSLGQAGVEGVALHRTSAPDAGRHDVLALKNEGLLV